MSLEIDQKLMKDIILSIKDDFSLEDNSVISGVVEEVLNSDDYKLLEFLWERAGFETVLKNREYHKGFLSRLMFEYHEPIVQFEILLENCLALIRSINYPRDKYPNMCIVLKGITMRAILITNEILCLIKNGFASGALARWRTLYEYSVIAIFIAKYGEDYALKYIAFEDIANYKEALVYAEYSSELQFEEISQTELNNLKKKCEDAKRKYPELNDNDYSWAKPVIKTPSFSALAKATDVNYYKPFYKFSCNYNHGGIKGLFFDIGQIYGLTDDDSVKLAQSNIGFTDPAQLTMHSLLDIISATLSLDIDTSKFLQLVFLKKKIPVITEYFVQVEQEITKREKALREEFVNNSN